MTALDLYRQLHAEPRPRDGLYHARRLSRDSGHRVAITSDGAPYFLIDVEIERGASEPVPLRNILVRYERDCAVAGPEGRETRPFAAVGCVDNDAEFREYFLRIVETMLEPLGPNPTWNEVIRALATILELFAALDGGPTKSIQGLWAELFVIHESSTPSGLISAWHATAYDGFDFSSKALRLDVKSTTARTRKHRFSFEQARPPTGTTGYIASVLLDVAGDGADIHELAAGIRQRVHDNRLHAKLEAIIAKTLGSSWRHAHGHKFDVEYARDHVRYYACGDVPCVEPPPPGVSSVHFDAVLHEERALSRDAVQGLESAWP